LSINTFNESDLEKHSLFVLISVSDLGMDQSLFVRLDGCSATYQLNLQYRMNRLSRVGCNNNFNYDVWWFSVAITRWSRSMQLLYIEPG